MVKLIKRYIYYAVTVAIIYLIMPVFFQGENYKYDFIEYQFVFPATALISGMIFSWNKGLDFTFPLIPPIIYMGSVFIHSHYYHWHIYVFIYLILAMLGCFIGDMVYKSDTNQKNQADVPITHKTTNRIKLTDITIESVEDFEQIHPEAKRGK